MLLVFWTFLLAVLSTTAVLSSALNVEHPPVVPVAGLTSNSSRQLQINGGQVPCQSFAGTFGIPSDATKGNATFSCSSASSSSSCIYLGGCTNPYHTWGIAYNGGSVSLSCEGDSVITDILFAGYGKPSGNYPDFNYGVQSIPFTIPLVQKLCLWNQNCEVPCSKPFFKWPEYYVPRYNDYVHSSWEPWLIVKAKCGPPPAPAIVKEVNNTWGLAIKSESVSLSCEGDNVITDILFAGYGKPSGNYPDFSYEAQVAGSGSLVRKHCFGRFACSIPVTRRFFSYWDTSVTAWLIVKAKCGLESETTDAAALCDLQATFNDTTKTALTKWCGAKYADDSYIDGPCSTGENAWAGVLCNGASRVVKVVLKLTPGGGHLPRSIGGLGALTWLELSSNRLSGTLPSELGRLTRVKKLLLSSNSFTGTVPTELGLLTSLQQLHLDSNMLSGPLPFSYCGLSTSISIWIYNNTDLTCIPPCLSNPPYTGLQSDLNLTVSCASQPTPQPNSRPVLKPTPQPTARPVPKPSSSNSSEYTFTCIAGTFLAGPSACTGCPGGTFRGFGDTARTCRPCQPGSYSAPFSSSCLTCIAGHYSSSGASSCTICPSGTYSLANASRCSPCDTGSFSAPGSSQCASCAS